MLLLPQPSLPLFIRSSPPPLEQPDAVEEEEEEEEKEKEEEGEEEEEEDKMLLLLVPVSFISCWKAVSRREALPSTASLKYNTNNLFYHLIECWQDIIIGKHLPQIFIINCLKAAVLYKR